MKLDTVFKWVTGLVQTYPAALRQEIDVINTNTRIIGETLNNADPDFSAAIWRIYRVIDNKRTEFASSGGFDQIWNNRGNLFTPVYTNPFSIILDGSSYGEVNHDATVDFASADPFSLVIWNKTKSTTANTYFQKSVSNTGYWFGLDGSGRPEFEARATGLGDRIHIRWDATPDLRQNTWNSLILTKNNTTNATGVNLYINGTIQTRNILNNTLTGSISNIGNLYIGASQNGSTPRVDGFIDEMAIIGKELSASEKDEIYNAGVPIDLSISSISADLRGWWQFNEDTPPGTFIDGSGNGNDATGVGIIPGDYSTDVPD